MELLEELSGRRAYRSISSEPIAPEVVARLLSAATLAPSCYNNQGWRYVAVSDPEALEKLRPSLSEGNAWALEAPLLILACTKPSLSCRLDEGRDYAYFDLGLSAMALMLQAQKEGIVAHPIAGFNPKKAKAALGVPADYVALALLVCGYRGENARLADWQLEREKGERQRKPVADVAFRDSWPLGD